MVGSMGQMPGLPPSKGQTPLLRKSKFVLRAMDYPMHSTNDKKGSLKPAHKTRAASQMFSAMKPDSNQGSSCEIGSYRKSLLPNLENPAKANLKPNSGNISTPWGRKIKIDSRYYKPTKVTAEQGCNNSYQRSKTQEIAYGNRIPTQKSNVSENADGSEDPGSDDQKLDADGMKQKEREKGKFAKYNQKQLGGLNRA